MSKRYEVDFLGVVIGTSTGWDQADSFDLQFYDFEPNEIGTLAGLKSSSCLGIFPWEGKIETYSDEGEPTHFNFAGVVASLVAQGVL